MSKCKVLDYLFDVEFSQKGDVEWVEIIINVKPLRDFITNHVSNNLYYYNQKFKLQSDYGFFNKLNFVINEFTQSENFNECDGFEKELIESTLRKKLQ